MANHFWFHSLLSLSRISFSLSISVCISFTFCLLLSLSLSLSLTISLYLSLCIHDLPFMRMLSSVYNSFLLYNAYNTLVTVEMREVSTAEIIWWMWWEPNSAEQFTSHHTHLSGNHWMNVVRVELRWTVYLSPHSPQRESYDECGESWTPLNNSPLTTFIS